MATTASTEIQQALDAIGLSELGPIHHNLAMPLLVEHAVQRGEAQLASNGALVAYTGARTGRSPKDRFIVREPSSAGTICWGAVNRPLEPAAFDRLLDQVAAYLQGRDLFVFDGCACADPAAPPAGPRRRREGLARPVRALPVSAPAAGRAWPTYAPDWTVLSAPRLAGRPGPRRHPQRGVHRCSTSSAATGADRRHALRRRDQEVGLLGPQLSAAAAAASSRCTARPTSGRRGDVALFFGLSGTGKTTLSADPERRLIGDDEHGWSRRRRLQHRGRLLRQDASACRPPGEPQICNAIRFGSVLENVVLDPQTREPDFDDDRLTENTRAAYPRRLHRQRRADRPRRPPANVLSS